MATTGFSISNEVGKIDPGINAKDKNDVKKWLNGSDIQLDFRSAQWEKNIPSLSSDSEDEDSEVEEEEIKDFKRRCGLKERFLAKLIEFDSVDEFEDEEGSDELNKEDNVRANMVSLQLDGFDLEIYTNIDGLKEDISAMIFQDGKHNKKLKHNE